MTSPTVQAAITPIPPAEAVASPLNAVLRDIARGGLTGVLVGVVGGGIGGRIAMRVAALLVPSSEGAFTENGNRIGDITLSGSLGLLLFGLAVGVFGGAIWVVVSPWIPGRGLRRALVTMPFAVAIGAFALIQGDNRDFVILDRDPAIVAMLVALVAGIGLLFPVVDDWLEHRMPVAEPSRRGILLLYAAVSGAGMLLVVPAAVNGILTAPRPSPIILGDALFVVGACTLAWWVLRSRGARRPPGFLVAVARAALAVAIVMGLAGVIPEISGALGMS